MMFLWIFSVFILTLEWRLSELRATTCGTIDCVAEAVGCKTNSNGTQICDCFVGVEGDACEIDRDECTEHVRSPCGHRGKCINTFGSYKCDCLRGWNGLTCRGRTSTPDFDCFPGWEGKFCMFDIDECKNVSAVCLGPHEHCVNTPGSYNCTCITGWTDSDCMTDIDECLNTTLCDDTQTCQNTPGSYGCLCRTGLYGDHCNQNIDECILEQPCGDAGRCIDTNGSFVCECSPEFTGDRCEINIEDIPMSSTVYAIIGAVAGLALLLLIIIIVVCCCVRFKLRDIRQKQEKERHMKMIQDRTTKVGAVEPMFSINRRLDDSLDNKWSSNIRNSQFKHHNTHSGSLLRNSPRIQPVPEYNHGNVTYSNMPYGGHKNTGRQITDSPSDLYPSRMTTNSAKPSMDVQYGNNSRATSSVKPNMAVQYGNTNSSYDSWETGRTTRYNSITNSSSYSSNTSRMSSVNSQPPSIPVQYHNDPVVDQ